MDKSEIKAISNTVSIPRLSEYEELGFEAESEELLNAYFHIQEVSSHFFVPIQILEVSIRNSLSDALSARFDQISDKKWYDLLPISDQSKDMLANAKRGASKAKEGTDKVVTDGDIIARLMFGFWVYLLEPIHGNNRQNPYHFWQYEIDNVFPGREGRNIPTMFDKLIQINKKRNRLYHHEPIWRKKRNNDFKKAINSLKKEYDLIITAIGWISPAKKKYMEELGFFQRFKDCCEKYQ